MLHYRQVMDKTHSVSSNARSRISEIKEEVPPGSAGHRSYPDMNLTPLGKGSILPSYVRLCPLSTFLEQMKAQYLSVCVCVLEDVGHTRQSLDGLGSSPVQSRRVIYSPHLQCHLWLLLLAWQTQAVDQFSSSRKYGQMPTFPISLASVSSYPSFPVINHKACSY